DKTFIDDLPAGTLVQGAHDHLDFDLVHNAVRYMHGASWGTHIGRLDLFATIDGIQSTYQSIPVDPINGEPGLASIIEVQKAEHLSDEDLEHIADIPSSMDLHNSILLATGAIRKATQADVAVVNHTTFGAPLSVGPMNRYDLNAFVRFGGDLKVASVTGGQLSAMLSGANQFAAKSLDARSGDYVHVAELDLLESKTYRLAVNSWTAQNQKTYLGTSDIVFEGAAGLELKTVIAEYLQSHF
ncbi:MAG: 5'-nucleotidase C-terminal domain-containing protein, partial [Rhizobiaceae bacterium]